MSEIRIKDNESLESALRRFKRQCAKSGVLAEVRKREHYEKPSVKRKKKSEAARKRKFKYALLDNTVLKRVEKSARFFICPEFPEKEKPWR